MKIKVTKEKAEEALAELNKAGKVSFDGEDGHFSVKGVVGRFNYNETEELLTVIIDDKPWLVTEEYVEEEIRNYFQ